MEELNDDYKYLFDDRELDDLEDSEIETDADFEKEMEEKYLGTQK